MDDSSSRKLAIAIIIVTAMLVAGLGVSRLFRSKGASVDVDREEFPVAGVDLSAHNGRPDFDSLATAVDFVYLKASEGTDFRDREFERNYAEASRKSIPAGAYHFFRFDCDGASQAANFISALSGRRLPLPPAIDIEEWGNPAGVSTELVAERLRTMVAMMRAEGYEPVLYTNKKGHARFLRGLFDSASEPALWICSFTNPPLPHTDWLFWQHSHCGRMPGVSGPVDLNTFNGTRGEWEVYKEKNSRGM